MVNIVKDYYRGREEPEEHVSVVDSVRGDEAGVVLGDGVANVRERFRDSGQVAPGLDVARVDVRGQQEGVAVPVRRKSCFYLLRVQLFFMFHSYLKILF